MRRRIGNNPGVRRGAARMRDLGYHCCVVWLDAGELLACRRGARKAGKKLATYLRWAGVQWYASPGGDGRPVPKGPRR